jgi:hypothetical protein
MLRRQDHFGVTGGVILILLGIAFLINQFFDIEILKFWPVILIVVGVMALKDGLGGRRG